MGILGIPLDTLEGEHVGKNIKQGHETPPEILTAASSSWSLDANQVILTTAHFEHCADISPPSYLLVSLREYKIRGLFGPGITVGLYGARSRRRSQGSKPSKGPAQLVWSGRRVSIFLCIRAL